MIWFLGDSLFFPGPDRESSIPFQLARRARTGGVKAFTSPGMTSADARSVHADSILRYLSPGDSLVVSVGLNDGTMGKRRPPHSGLPRLLYRWHTLRENAVATSSSYRTAVSVDSFRENLRAIITATRRRGCRIALVVPRCPWWIPAGQGMDHAHWFVTPLGFLPREDTAHGAESVLDALFWRVGRMARAGEYCSAIEALTALESVRNLPQRAVDACVTNRAWLLVKKGDHSGARLLLDTYLASPGRHPAVHQMRTWILVGSGEPSEAEMRESIDSDLGLPRMRSSYRDAVVRLTATSGAVLCNFDRVLKREEVLDHCHVTRRGAVRAAAELARLLSLPDTNPDGFAQVQWTYPRIDYAVTRGDLRSNFRISRSEGELILVPGPLRELLLAHPGILDEEDLIGLRCFPHEAERYPELIWQRFFSGFPQIPLTTATEILSDLVRAPDPDLFPTAADGGGQGGRPFQLRTLCGRLARHLSTSTIFGPRVVQRLSMLRKWYSREAVLFGGGSTWLALIERQEVLAAMQALNRISAYSARLGLVEGIDRAASILVSIANLLQDHEKHISIVITTLYRAPFDFDVAVDSYRQAVSVRKMHLLREILEMEALSPPPEVGCRGAGHPVAMRLTAMGIRQALADQRASESRGTSDKVAPSDLRLSRGGSEDMYPLA